MLIILQTEKMHGWVQELCRRQASQAHQPHQAHRVRQPHLVHQIRQFHQVHQAHQVHQLHKVYRLVGGFTGSLNVEFELNDIIWLDNVVFTFSSHLASCTSFAF